MLLFDCPSCNTKLQAVEEHAGKTIVCPQCRQTATVPSPVGPAASAISVEPLAGSVPYPTGVTTANKMDSARKNNRDRDDDDDDDDEDDSPRRRDTSGADSAKAVGTGLGVGAIVAIVLGVGGCCLLGVGAILVALLVPAVQKVREAAARTQSINNLKQISLAAISFHDAHKHLPFNGSDADGFGNVKYRAIAVGGNAQSGSWAFQILPFIEQVPMFNAVDKTRGIPTYLCPGRGRPPLENGGGAWTDYFYNNYLNDPTKAATPNNPDMMRSLLGITDGSSNTIFAGHGNINLDQYKSPANVTLSTNIFVGGTTGTMRSGNNGKENPTGVTLQRDSNNNPVIGSWGGPFPQGGLMAMCDGSVRTFPYGMNQFGVFLTPNGKEIAALPDF